MSHTNTMGTGALKREIIKIKPKLTTDAAKLLVAGYARVSSDSDNQLNSFSAQVRYYTAIIEKNPDYEFTEVYADEGLSGVSAEKREDFNRMLEDCRKGKINRIITKSVSRFARNTMDTISTIRELKAMGVTVLFEKENIDTASLTSENLLTLYALFAQEESLSISKNCKKGNRMRMQKGEYVSSNPPYGYRLTDNQLEPYEPEAEVVRRIFTEYLGGSSIVKIAQGLIADGIPRKDGKPNWRHQAISMIIKNERYAGDMLLQKYYNEDTMPYRKCKNQGELPQYFVKSSHEPIVERIQFELANILLRERGELITTEYGDYPLSRKIRCGNCDAVYRRKITNGKIYWVCRVHDSDKSLCTFRQVPETAIYAAFVRMYNKLKQHYGVILLPMLSQLERLQDARNKGNTEISGINKQIAELSEQNHVMNGLLTKGILDSALFISQTDEINRKLRALKLAKARLIEEGTVDNPMDKTEELIEFTESGPDHITTMDEIMLGDMVESIIARDTDTIDFILINGLRLTEGV